ncbi:MAG: hypothetical protein IRY92_05715, partial [Dactylosporangium sp.]|nr:hypothetical protein [Dactylosporangium sp.]
MGIWDVVRLLARRWPVSVPLLLLTGGAAMLTAHHVRPDYVATSYVSLLPPAVQYNPKPGQTTKVNPWDVDRLREAVIVRLTTTSVRKQIGSEGFEGSWTVATGERYGSIIRIEVTSATEEDARATLGRLVHQLDDEVVRQQAGYPSLGPADRITTTRYDAGDEVKVVTARIWRAVLVVVTGGLLVAA